MSICSWCFSTMHYKLIFPFDVSLMPYFNWIQFIYRENMVAFKKNYCYYLDFLFSLASISLTYQRSFFVSMLLQKGFLWIQNHGTTDSLMCEGTSSPVLLPLLKERSLLSVMFSLVLKISVHRDSTESLHRDFWATCSLFDHIYSKKEGFHV